MVVQLLFHGMSFPGFVLYSLQDSSGTAIKIIYIYIYIYIYVCVCVCVCACVCVCVCVVGGVCVRACICVSIDDIKIHIKLLFSILNLILSFCKNKDIYSFLRIRSPLHYLCRYGPVEVCWYLSLYGRCVFKHIPPYLQLKPIHAFRNSITTSDCMLQIFWKIIGSYMGMYGIKLHPR